MYNWQAGTKPDKTGGPALSLKRDFCDPETEPFGSLNKPGWKEMCAVEWVSSDKVGGETGHMPERQVSGRNPY
jgi:hypothetical protein